MREKRFNALAVIQAAADAAAIRGADGQWHIPLAVGAVVHFGSFVDDLVKSRVDKIRELDLADWMQIGHSSANANGDDRKLGQRRIDDSVWAIFFKKANRR